MKKNKGGRKPLGDNKRKFEIKVRFNSKELEQFKTILQFYNLDFNRRGVVGPFSRRLLLNNKIIKNNNDKNQKLPDSFSNLIFQINKIGININQLTKIANYKNMRSPNSKLQNEIQKSNELMRQILRLLNSK